MGRRASAWLVSLALGAPAGVARAAPDTARDRVAAGATRAEPAAPNAAASRTERSEPPTPETTAPGPGRAEDPSPQADTERAGDGDSAGTTPDPAAVAERAFLEGQRLFREGRYADAAGSFARSYQAVPVPSTLYNEALAHERAGATVQALTAYRRYLAEATVDAGRRAEVEEVIQRLEGQVARLELSVPGDVKLQAVRLDGELVPLSAFPLELEPGTVHLALEGEGGAVQRQTLELAAGRTVRVHVAPFETNAPATDPPAPRVPDPPGAGQGAADEAQAAARRRRLRAVFWVGLGTTAASGVAVAVLGSLALRSARRFNDAKCPEVCTPELMEQFPGYPQDEYDRALRLQTATNAMIGVGAGVALATTLVGVLAFGKRKRKRPAPPRRARVHVHPTGTGLALSGRF